MLEEGVARWSAEQDYLTNMLEKRCGGRDRTSGHLGTDR